jgi:hypothetical protein
MTHTKEKGPEKFKKQRQRNHTFLINGHYIHEKKNHKDLHSKESSKKGLQNHGIISFPNSKPSRKAKTPVTKGSFINFACFFFPINMYCQSWYDGPTAPEHLNILYYT